MKQFVVLTTLCALAVGVPASAEENPDWNLVDGVVAMVGGRPVLMSEVAAAVALEEAKLRAKERAGLSAEEAAKERGKARAKAVKALVENVLLLLAGEQQCPMDSECGERMTGEVDKRLGQFLDSTKEDPSQRERFFRSRGLASQEQYRKSIQDELLRQLYVGLELGKGGEISQQEAAAEMERRFGGKKARDAGCDAIRVREMGMEHVEFPVEATAGLDTVLARYEAAYRCYLGLQRGEVEPDAIEEMCGKDGEVHVFQTGTSEGSRLRETASFAPAYKEAFDSALEKGTGEFSEPFILGKNITMIRLIDVQYRCITVPEEQAEILEGLMGRMAEQRQGRRLEAVLDQLKSEYPVEVPGSTK